MTHAYFYYNYLSFILYILRRLVLKPVVNYLVKWESFCQCKWFYPNMSFKMQEVLICYPSFFKHKGQLFYWLLCNKPPWNITAWNNNWMLSLKGSTVWLGLSSMALPWDLSWGWLIRCQLGLQPESSAGLGIQNVSLRWLAVDTHCQLEAQLRGFDFLLCEPLIGSLGFLTRRGNPR